MGYQTEETAIARKLVEWLKKKQLEGAPLLWEHRSGSGGYSYQKGRPDFWVSANGHHIEMELKAPDGKLSPMQEQFRWRCGGWHVPYCCPRSAEEAIEFIELWLLS